ncbi:MAG: MFS transporter [Acidobacteriota bacterium]|nr:MFS transporter [Acidobacteriota bacterium]
MSVPVALVRRPEAVTRPSVRWILAGLSLVMLLPSLDTSIANAGLPVLAQAFGASFQQVQWIVLSYLLAITTLIVSAGRLGDMIGRRTLLLAAIVVFTLASLLCGASSSLWMLLGARAAQGLGAAAMMALAIALVGDAVPAENTGRAMGLLGSMSAIGTALGPSLGGVLMALFGWQSIFLVNVPLGIAAFELVRRHVAGDDRSRPPTKLRFDFAGTALLAIALGAYALAATLKLASFGPVNAALAGLSVLAGTAFYLVEQRTAFPLIRLATLRDPIIGSGLAMSALVSMVMMTTLVVGPFYRSRVLGLSGMAAGFVLSAGPVVAALTGVPAGRFADRIGAHRMTVVGLAGIAAGAIGLVVVPATVGIGGYVGPIIVMTSSYASFQAANNTAIMSSVRGDHRGVVAALLTRLTWLEPTAWHTLGEVEDVEHAPVPPNAWRPPWTNSPLVPRPHLNDHARHSSRCMASACSPVC